MASLTLRDFVGGADNTCTVNFGTVRQPAFACTTCDMVLCRSCHPTHPHRCLPLGHRRFRCERDGQLDASIPNDIRRGIFCYCHECDTNSSNGGGGGGMWQCIGCDDWFHTTCIKQDLNWIDDEADGDFVCRQCMARFPFAGCQQFDNISWLLPAGWKPCDCALCKERFGDLFADILELPDTTEQEQEQDQDDIDGAGLDKASVLRTIDGYQRLKSKLSLYLQSLPDGHVVTAADIREFMATISM